MSKGGGNGQTKMMEEMLGMAQENIDYFQPKFEEAEERVYGTYTPDIYEDIIDEDPDSETFGEVIGQNLVEEGGELIEGGSYQDLQEFEWTNPYADMTNPYADIRTDFDNPSTGMGNVAEDMTNVAQGAIDPSRGLRDWSRGMTDWSGDMTNVAAGAKNMYANMQNQMAGMDNAYAGLENQYEGMENAFEDATIDTKAAEFQAQQTAQQQANIMQGLRGAAGSSGVAALAQSMANQGQLAAQQAAAGIGQQERQNQMMQMQEASRMQQMQRGEASRLQSQEAMGAMDIQQRERAGAARVQEQQAAGAMQAQQQRIAGAQALQGYQAQAAGQLQGLQGQAASQLQGLQYQGAQEKQRQYLAGAQALQDAQLKGALQFQDLQFEGQQWADEMNAAQENLKAQGAWTADATVAAGEAAVQQAEYGQLSTLLGIDLGAMAGMQGALTGAQGNQMAGMGGMAEMFGSQAAANQSMWASVGSTVATIAKIYFKCMPKGTNIDCVDGKQTVESIKPGDTIIGYNGSPVKVLQKHEYLEDPTRDVFYQVEFKGEGSKTHKVDVCDMHRIKGIRAKDITENVISKKVYGGVEFSYDLLTEDAGYRIDGIPVNSMIAEMASEIVKTIKNK